MRLCAITDRKLLEERAPVLESEARDSEQALLHLTSGWSRGGVDLIQLREKDLDLRSLRRLAEEIQAGADRRHCRLLINLPLSPAGLREMAPIADGIHIPGCPAPGAVVSVRRAFHALGREAIVSLACHSIDQVRTAVKEGADMILFAPVFEKPLFPQRDGATLPGQALGALRIACEAAGEMPVFALGGVTARNAASCEAAGAAGIAGIRLFAQDEWRSLRPPSVQAERALPFRSTRSTDI